MKVEDPGNDLGVEVVGAFAAKTHLSSLLRKARAGQRIIITQRGQPMAQLTPLPPPKHPRRSQWGDMKGKIRVTDDFCGEIEEMRDYMP